MRIRNDKEAYKVLLRLTSDLQVCLINVMCDTIDKKNLIAINKELKEAMREFKKLAHLK